MTNVYCDNDECEHCGEIIFLPTETDDRQEWLEEIYECKHCGTIKIRRVERDQNGLIISDNISTGEEK